LLVKTISHFIARNNIKKSVRSYSDKEQHGVLQCVVQETVNWHLGHAFCLSTSIFTNVLPQLI